LDNLVGEDTALLHEVSQQHQNLCKKFSDSFPQSFHRIQLNGYFTRALEDHKHTLEQMLVSTPHSCALLCLPQYDPKTMKIPKQSWGHDLNLGWGGKCWVATLWKKKMHNRVPNDINKKFGAHLSAALIRLGHQLSTY
jgi:hypothetical protein